MKRTLWLTVLILLLIISCNAQKNLQKSAFSPETQKFDIIIGRCGTELSVRMQPFIKVLRKKPTAKAYIIVYPGADFMIENAKDLLDTAKSSLKSAKIAPNRIVLLVGGLREELMTELFIVPKGAIPPDPTIDEKSITLNP